MMKRLTTSLAAVFFCAALSIASSHFLLAQVENCDPSVSNCDATANQQNPNGNVQQQRPDYNDQGQWNGSVGNNNNTPGYGNVGNPLYVPNYQDTLGLGQYGANRNGTPQQANQGVQNPYIYTPPTDFQRLVFASVGRRLPIFGANLFFNTPSTFAPVDQVPVTPDYTIGPGDQILVRVWGQVNFNAEVTVDRSGTIYLPQVGAIHVGGLTDSALASQIRTAVSRIYKNFNLSVNLGQLRSIRIFVTGQARRPGTYTVSSLSTLVSALFSSGGPSPTGSLRRIQLRRSGATVAVFDLYDLLVHGDKSKDVPLIDGDVLYIPPVGPEVAVFGSVRNQAIYELLGETTINQVLADAGGLATNASVTHASLERINRQVGQQQALDITLQGEGLETPMHGGDILRVLPITPQFTKTVTLRGNVADPGRFAWHPGMMLNELLPDSRALITRDYWQRRNELGLPSPSFQPDYTQNMRVYASGRNPYANGYNPNQPIGNNGQNNNQPNDQINNGQSIAQMQGLQSGTGNNDTGQNAQYNGNPTPSGQNSLNPRTPGYAPQPTETIGGSTLADQQQHTFTENTANADQLLNVALSAPEIDWSYAVIERLDPVTLRTSLIPFDLGKLVIEHDPSQNLAVEPGDVITIFSQADIHVPVAQQTKLVRLEGEVVHAGIYSAQPNETLRHLVERAGGLTPNAYLFGSELTRESARIVQQQRLNDYVTQLELEIDRASASTAASAISSQDQASASGSLTASQLLVSRLRRLRASGRVVLSISPKASTIASLPDLELEDGDRFIVPTRPSSVSVVGAVYDQNSFVFADDHRVKAYLRQAGGPNRSADQKHSFILRADGSVISRESANTLWGNTFDEARIEPGDTIVVPEKVYRGSATRNLINYSAILGGLSNIGLTAVLATR